MHSLKVRVSKKIFAAPESGFAVLKVQLVGGRESRIIVGELAAVHEGDFLQIEGGESEHPRFGRQFKVSRFQFLMPEDSEGMIHYLSSGRIKGIGRKTAEKIVAHFGTAVFEILERSPERLAEIPGIRRSLAGDIGKHLRENRTLRELAVKLQPFGIGYETILKVQRQFGVGAPDVLMQNPYWLINRIPGIGFRTADAIGRAFGIARTESQRLRAGILHLLEQSEFQNGDLYSPQAELQRRAIALLDVPEAAVAEELERLLAAKVLWRDEGDERPVQTPANFSVEFQAAEALHRLATTRFAPEAAATDIASRLSAALTEEQKQAVCAAAANRVTIITGGPGTGKTTIIRAIIEVCRSQKKRVAIAAPTGRAAKRIEESSHYRASTIHRLLKINPETGRFVHHAGNPLDVDTLIVDEFSMVDAHMFQCLLQAVAEGTQMILIGDKDQLPSVGPGNVLRDLIASGTLPTIYLQRNFRQEADSLIVENAHRINRGDALRISAYRDDLDFVLLPIRDPEAAAAKVCAILEFYRPTYPFNSPQFQILVPMYRGAAGIDRINQLVQERFNPEPFLIENERLRFKKFDKVMQLKNNYEKEVFNGDQGIVVDFQPQTQMLEVDFDGQRVAYGPEEREEIAPAYAVSVHKSQGSEYEVVVLVLLEAHRLLLTRELFYTAVTRARKRLLLLSNDAAIAQACAESRRLQRRTLLQRRLQDRFRSDAPAL